MSGVSITDPDTPITATTRSLLAFRQAPASGEYACIGCGRCISKCPARLMPIYIYRNYKAGNLDTCAYLQSQSCIGCGVCSYICPSNMELAQIVGAAKRQLDLNEEEGE